MTTEPTQQFTHPIPSHAASAQQALDDASENLKTAIVCLHALAMETHNRHERHTLERMSWRVSEALIKVGDLPRVPGLPEVPQEVK